MKIDGRRVMPPLLAALILILTLRQTMSALSTSGSWRAKPRVPRVRPEDPYARLDGLLSRALVVAPADRVRDPFGFGGPVLPSQVATRTPTTPHSPKPAPAPLAPVLTSIIFDADPRATIRYADRDFSVRENSLFAEFRVRSITSTQVVLERNGQPLVLTLRSKGE